MSANNFNMKYESTTEVPATSEYYTYYPTWFNGKTTVPTTTVPTSTTMPTISTFAPTTVGSKSYASMVEELQKESIKYGIQRPVEDIVISGVSGKFPESDNVEEFAQNLYNGVDMVNEGERRWPSGLFGLPKRTGTIKDITRFDAQFFGIHPKQVDNMDPQLRILLEVAYEAVFDAGLNPAEMKGTRTGVFIGASGSDAQYAFSVEPETLSGYSMTGCATSMLANRLSYFFDFKGPSFVIDTACSSSLVALDAAITAIKTGQCDYAIVGGVNLLARPQTSLQFQKLGMLSQEGKCKSFDAQGKGYVRSETVGAILIQKKDACKRFYAKVLHSKVNTDGAKEQGITYPSGAIQSRLLREIYAESDIDPSLVTYVEAHGTGTKVGDPQELNSIAEVFASQQSSRNVPLFIGSTKSNMGHSEPASGIAALVKMLISIQRGIIPANLHFQEPNHEVPALIDGRLKVVNVNTKFRGGLMALNSFGFGGANAHILLQPNNDYTLNRLGAASLWNQDLSELTSQPRLFQFCSRTQSGLEEVIDHMQKNTADLAKQVLLQANSTTSPVTHPFRGFTILNGQKHQGEFVKEIKQITTVGEKKPIFFIFSGMGTQYQGMGQELMKLDTFRQSIIRSAETLKPYGINLIDIIYAKHNVYERTLNAFVGIAAIQIALVDCLRQAGVEADGIIGHSVGELGCAYADNCFTAEETILAAYYRGKCIEDAQLPIGAMAAVGMTWAECQRRCPSGVVPACHNSVDTVTISGPKLAVAEFVQQLKSEGIFAKEVDSSNVAFHSYYMTSIAPTLKKSLEKVIPVPKLRSNKWISTSMPEQRWETELARYSSPDYHVNNLCSPVLFQEALKFIPANAIVVEIAPHALLQAILKRSLPTQVTTIPLLKKDVPSHLEHFWTQLGRMYTEGVNIDTIKLFVPFGTEKSLYPVPVSTGFVSHLVKWDHEQQYNTPKYEDFLLKQTNGPVNTTKYTIDLTSEKDAFLAGHQIDGRIIYPATGYIYLVWKTLAKMQGFTDVEQLPVTFENIEIHQATILATKEQLKNQQTKKVTLSVSITPVTGLFEVTEAGNVVVSGSVFTPERSLEFFSQKSTFTDRKSIDLLEQSEIYKDLNLRGYEYSGEFQPIIKSDVEGLNGDLVFTGKWISFLDGMLQMNVLSQKRGLLLPTRIRCIRIDPRIHTQSQKTLNKEEFNAKYFNNRYFNNKYFKQLKSETLSRDQYESVNFNTVADKQQTFFVLPVSFDLYTNTTVCGGVEITGLHATIAPRRQIAQPTILERVNFVPYVEKQFDEEFNLLDNCTCNNTTISRKEFPQCVSCEYVPVPESEKREALEYYLEECKRHTLHILRKIEYPTTVMQIIQPTPTPKNFVQKFEHLTIQTPSVPSTVEFLQGGKLLQLLKEVANIDSTDGQFFYKVQKTFNDKFAYFKALEEDRVLNFLNKRSSYLKSFLDTVLENTQFAEYKQQNKLKVLEISPSMGQFFGVKVNKFLKTHPQVSQMDYHYVPTQFGEYTHQSEEIFSELNLALPYPIQKVEWNLTSNNNGRLTVTEPPKHLKDFDLVIFNGSLSTLLPYFDSEFEVKQWLQTVVEKVMKPEGFLFVHEFTNNFETLNSLNQLEQIIFRQPVQKIQKFSTFPAQKYQSEQQWRQIIEDAGFSPVALKCDTVLSTMFLYRIPSVFQNKPINSLSEEKIYIDDQEQYNWIEQVKNAMITKQTQRVWLISEKSPNSGIVGLVNCLRKEIGGEKIRCIFVADKQPICLTGYLVPSIKEQGVEQTTVQWTHLFDQLRRADMVMNVFRHGKWGSFRHMLNVPTMEELVLGSESQFNGQYTADNQSQLRNAYINMQSRGDLSSLQWMQSPEPYVKDIKEQVHCQVSYAALNFRDIMLATGKLTPEAIPGYYKMQDGLLGMEFSGKDAKGQRFMGMVPAKGLATSVVVDQKYLWEVPQEWSLKQAATVPVAYSTAYYALVVRGQLKQGETVLIHAGSGAVGQAAIAIALSYKCKVFITVSSDEKREFLKALFPGQLSDSQFANSRDIFFEKHIMQLTRGAGVDVVLNSLAGDKLQASIRVLAQHGRFLEIGKFDLNKNSQLGMSAFLKNISFHGILVDSLFENDNLEWMQIYQLVKEGIRSGVVRPLNSTIFEKHQIEEAFRFMAQGKHMGKVLVKVSFEPKEITEQTNYINGFPKVWFSPLKTYIVTGGLGGFGLELTQWMIERGARHMILTSRSGLKTGYQAKKIRNLQEEFGATIKIAPFDVKEEHDCRLLFAEAKKCPEGKIGGIFHLAAIVDDGLFETQTADRFKTVNEVKAKGAYNLDMFSRTEGIMDDSAFFVVFSSVTSGRGNAGQTNYGYANSAMERICEYRRRDNKHALAIQWGAIGDVGMIVDSVFGGNNETIVGGTMPQRIQSCLKTLELLLLKSAEPKETAIWSSFVPAERINQFNTVQKTVQTPKSIVEVVANILGLKDIKQIRSEQITLGELGLDSLMNVEIKQFLEQAYNLPLSMREIQQLTLEKLRLIENTKTSPLASDLLLLNNNQTTTYSNKKVSYLMPTKTIEKMNVIEFLPQKHIPVVVIHPIEGHTNMLKTWAKHMKYPVFGVQYTEEATRFETIEQLADFYWQQIEQELAKHGKSQLVHLCGYSFGASVAFEIAAQRSSRIASLTFLDGSHLYVNAHINTYKNKFQLENIHQTEAEALSTFVQQYTQVFSRKQLIDEMIQMPTFEQKVRFVVRELLTKSQFTFEPIDLEQAARSFVAKLFMSYKYQPKQVLRLKEALLIKSGERTNLVQALGEDYGLGQVIAGKIQIETVFGDHRSFLDAESGFQVASLMNEFLLRNF